MRYQLGSFSPLPGSGDYAGYFEDQNIAGPMTRALEEMLRVRLSLPPGAGSERQPDLLEKLGTAHRDKPWVEAVYQRMNRLRGDQLDLRLLACEYEADPDGFLTIAVSAPATRIEVFPDDWMQVGFAAMREGYGSVRAWPRLLREVCQNGSLVCVSELASHEGGAGIGDAIETFLSPGHYESAIRELQETKLTTVHDPSEFLDEIQRAMEVFGLPLSDLLERAAERFQDGEDGDDVDDSLYGLVNAVTATARDLSDWRERLALEEMAGWLVRLRRPVPSRSGGAMLIPH
jgi:hypothetical protein